MLAALALWAWRQRPSVAKASAVGLIGAILASPIAWVHYTLFLLPIFFGTRASLSLRVASVLFVVPVPVVLSYLGAPTWQQLTIGSVYGWATLLCLVAVLVDIRTRNAPDLLIPQ